MIIPAFHFNKVCAEALCGGCCWGEESVVRVKVGSIILAEYLKGALPPKAERVI